MPKRRRAGSAENAWVRPDRVTAAGFSWRACKRTRPRDVPQSASLLAGVGPLQRREIELHHFRERGCDPSDALLIGVQEHLQQALRRHLPGDAKAVVEPTALVCVAAVDQHVPVAIDFGLILASDEE